MKSALDLAAEKTAPVVNSLKTVNEQTQALAAEVAVKTAALDQARAEAQAIQADFEALVERRNELRHLVARATGGIPIVQDRIQVLEREMRWQWIQNKGLADHIAELTAREIELRYLPVWLKTAQTELDAVNAQLAQMAAQTGASIPD